MKIYLENVNTSSNSGPNSFAKKLIPELEKQGCEFTQDAEAEVSLCFIESHRKNMAIPRIQRLDGIYFNIEQNYHNLNSNIKRTYLESQGIVFQSEFNKKLISKYFGEPENSTVIHNGADIASIDTTRAMSKGKYDNIWSCAASWRPHKRLNENIRYFLEHKGENDLLVVAGEVPPEERIKDDNIAYFGKLSQIQLFSLYKASTNFLHLAWLDHCPNVVVDARACGCHIICSSDGGTKEIAGMNSTIIEEVQPWDFEPTKLYKPPQMDFQRKIKNDFKSCYDMEKVAKLYKSFMESTIRNENN
jgi:hypothetical protein|tara:strand:+ start:1230 stop:2138 length:909 start_codon:yes stop_codon:yes gene_type:complete